MGQSETSERLRVVVADEDDGSRRALTVALHACEDVEVIADVSDGGEAMAVIERLSPDLCFLDVALRSATAFDVLRNTAWRNRRLLFAVTGDTGVEAANAFESNALDYLLKPVTPTRLRVTLQRAKERLESAEMAAEFPRLVERAALVAPERSPSESLRHIPVRTADEITIVPTKEVVSVVAHGEDLHISTVTGERHVITYRLKDLETRLDPEQFVRLSRGTLVNIDFLHRFESLPSGLLKATLSTGQQHAVSRIRARVLRERMLRL